MSERFALTPGMVIICSSPFCDEYIGRVTKHLKAGDKMMDCMEGPGIRHGEKPQCKRCGHLWYFEEQGGASGRWLSRIHLASGGWFPPIDRIQANE